MQIVSLQAMSKDELIALLLKERQEHSDTLDAIGAGGLGRNRITQKTLEQHRKEFEEWTKDHYFLCEVTLHKDGDGYSHLDMDLAWEAWKAARGITE